MNKIMQLIKWCGWEMGNNESTWSGLRKQLDSRLRQLGKTVVVKAEAFIVSIDMQKDNHIRTGSL